jgi:hypothetical protein
VDVRLFFNCVENLFDSFQIDDDLRAKLLLPLLTERARSIIGRMPKADLDKYDAIKQFLLTEYKITPRQIRSKFMSVVKQNDETYQLFASRLSTMFQYYTKSRDVVDNYDKLCEVIVADRLKETLPSDALQYVLSLEGESWFKPSKVASLADTFVNNCRERPRMYGGPSLVGNEAKVSKADECNTNRPAAGAATASGYATGPIKRKLDLSVNSTFEYTL